MTGCGRNGVRRRCRDLRPSRRCDRSTDLATVANRREISMISPEADRTEAAIRADRARIKQILALPESRGREGLAKTLALYTDMNIAEARAALNAAPRAGAEAAAVEAGTTDNSFDWERAGKQAAEQLLSAGVQRICATDGTTFDGINASAADPVAFDFSAYNEGAQAAKRLLGKES